MSHRPTPGVMLVRRAGIAGVAMVLAAAVPLTSAMATPSPNFPSKEKVAAAKAAVTTTSGKVAELDARYQEASARLESVQEQAAAAGEAYNGAKLLLDQRTNAAKAAAQTAAAAQVRADDAQRMIRQFASQAYQQNGSLGEVSAFLSTSGPQDLVDRATAMDMMGTIRTEAYAKADSTSQLADTARRRAQQAQTEQQSAAAAAATALADAQAQAASAATEATQIQADQQSMATQLAALQKTSLDVEKARQEGLRAEAIAKAAAEEAARQARIAAEKAARERTARAAAEAAAAKAAADEAAARARAASRAASSLKAAAARASAAKAAARAAARAEAERQAAAQAAASHPSTPTPAPSSPQPAPVVAPPTRGGVSAVIAYAQAQIGKWYLWGGAGPDQFDCSGLTMMAWRRAGVYLDHYTGSQYNQTRRVAIADLRPGDLVFYGDSGPTSHHVGLYVGNGQMIEAAHTGTQIRYASIYRSDLLPYGGRP